MLADALVAQLEPGAVGHVPGDGRSGGAELGLVRAARGRGGVLGQLVDELVEVEAQGPGRDGGAEGDAPQVRVVGPLGEAGVGHGGVCGRGRGAQVDRGRGLAPAVRPPREARQLQARQGHGPGIVGPAVARAQGDAIAVEGWQRVVPRLVDEEQGGAEGAVDHRYQRVGAADQVRHVHVEGEPGSGPVLGRLEQGGAGASGIEGLRGARRRQDQEQSQQRRPATADRGPRPHPTTRFPSRKTARTGLRPAW